MTKGTLMIEVLEPNQEPVWETTLPESADEQLVDLAPAASGRYTVLVTGDETAGDFALSWTVRE